MDSNTHTNQVIAKMRDTYGEEMNTKWQDFIRAAIPMLHAGDDLTCPLTINGQQFEANGRTITALGVLDMLADMLGVEAISQGAQFDNVVTL